MAKYTIGFIGTGNMGGALALAASRGAAKESLALSDKAADKAEVLAKKLGCRFTDNETLAGNSRYIFLGVKPQYLESMLGEIAPALSARTDRFILVSMAAGVTIGRIREILKADYPVIRIMPNTPCGVGEGMTLYCPSENVSEDEARELLTLMASAGRFEVFPEHLIDAGSAISGCGPAFAYLFLDALADGGVAAGLSKEQSVRLAAQTLLGAARMVLSDMGSPASLKDAVCSPGGSTIAGVKALEDGAFRAAAMNAVAAAFKRTQELGK